MSVVMTCDGVMSEGHVVWACWGFEALEARVRCGLQGSARDPLVA
jgi:hypothetical protein